MQLIKYLSATCIVFYVLFFCAAARADTLIEEWVARYNGPENDDDKAHAMALDRWGNVYVTGESYEPFWGDRYATLKYTPDNNESVWVAEYCSPVRVSCPHDIAVDYSGNIYVAGYGQGVGTNLDYVTIKYDPNGTQLWVRRYNGDASPLSEWAKAVAVDTAGNVYVTGRGCYYYVGTNCEYTTIKYDPNGNEVWIAKYNSSYHYGTDEASDIALDNLGNVYVTGNSEGSVTVDYATIKYASDSNEPVWVARYNGPGNGSDMAEAIAIDNSGNVYVTGRSAGGTGDDYATVKYDPNGNELWVARYNGQGNGADVAFAIAIDDSSNIYVTGRSQGIGTSSDYVTIKYASDSNEPVWVARYNGPGNGSDSAEAIALDRWGNVYVTGESYDPNMGYDYATLKYTPDNNEPVWVARYNGPGNDDDRAYAIAVENDWGDVYVTGRSYDPNTDYDYATIKYSWLVCTSPLDSDLNDDCKVDFRDVAILAENWLKCNFDPPEACWD